MAGIAWLTVYRCDPEAVLSSDAKGRIRLNDVPAKVRHIPATSREAFGDEVGESPLDLVETFDAEVDVDVILNYTVQGPASQIIETVRSYGNTLAETLWKQ